MAPAGGTTAGQQPAKAPQEVDHAATVGTSTNVGEVPDSQVSGAGSDESPTSPPRVPHDTRTGADRYGLARATAVTAL